MATSKLTGRLSVLLLAFAVMVSIAALVAGFSLKADAQASPTIQSDKDDYAPGELVTLTGSGWQPNESVNINVNDDVGQTWNRNVNVTADASGNITDQFNLPDWFVAVYQVRATGTQSGAATTSFTDGDVRFIGSANAPSTWTQKYITYSTNDCTGTPSAEQQLTMSGSVEQRLTLQGNRSLKLVSVVENSTAVDFDKWTNQAGDTVTTATCFSGQGAEHRITANFKQAPPADTTAPTVSSIVRAAASPTNAASVSWTVTFSENVTGVDATDFQLANTGLTGPGPINVTGSGTTYTVTASTGTGNGSLGLNLVDNDTIKDVANLPLGGAGNGNGNKTGEVYSIAKSQGTSISDVSGSGTYGGNATLTAKLASGTTNLANKQIQFKLNNQNVGSPQATDANGVATLSGVSLSGINAGSYPGAVGASFAGDSGYDAASGTGALTVAKANQTIDFGSLANKTFGDQDFQVSATATSGLAVTFASQTTGVCTVTGNTVHIVSGGLCTIKASQAGNGNYEAATDVQQSFTINTAASNLSFNLATLPAKTYGDAAFGVASYANSNSPAPVTFALGAGSVGCTVSPSGQVTITGAATGTEECVIEASQAATAEYAAAGPLSQSFNISKADTTTTVTCTGGPFTYDGTEKTPCSAKVTGPVGLEQAVTPVTYTNNTNAGTATASATYAGTANYNGSSGSEDFTIGKANASINVQGFQGPYDGDAHGATGTATGVGGADLSSLLHLGASFTNVPGGTANWTFDGNANYNADSGSVEIQIEKASSKTTMDCPASVTYDGSAKTPCTASVTGAGGLEQPLDVTYEQNTNAGTATASASFDGDPNHTGSQGQATFQIEKASSTTTVECPANVTYDGSAKESCTASVTGAGGLEQPLNVSYQNNTNAGTATASASFVGDANHTASSDSKTFTIEKASSTTTVDCPASVTYDGSAKTPCTASVTGAGGLEQPLDVTYEQNINAGTATASASFDGDPNHTGSSDSNDFQIEKAASNVTVDCPASVTYDGSAKEPCTASVTGAGGLNQAVTPVTYEQNTNAGTATASASFNGDANHTGSQGQATFQIEKASSTTTVSCDPGPFIYNGTAKTPCEASVTGAGDLNRSLDVTYSDNTNAGTATASASFDGDANHTGSSDSENFTIGKADTTTTVTCSAGPFTYDGTAKTPCSAKVTGPGDLDQSLDVTYSNNTGAGTATASASYAETANYKASQDSENFTIGKADTTTTVSCNSGPFTYDGTAKTPCSAKVSGPGGLSETLQVSYANNTNAGTATASASFAETANYNKSTDSKTFEIGKAKPSVTITWSDSTYDGNANAATAKVSGVGTETPGTASLTYYEGSSASGSALSGAPKAAGTYTVKAEFNGSSNYEAASNTKTINIAKADTTTAVSCNSGPFTYDGTAKTPCSAKVTGPGGLDQSLSVSYTNNTGAGTATASASFAETANYKSSSGTKDFTIGKADTNTTVTCPTSVTFDGSPKTPCSAKVTGPSGLDQSLNVTYSNNTLGQATASASFAETANYKGSQASKNFSIEYGWKGFLQPINDTAHQTGVTQSKFKLGQTIPVKFAIYNAAGTAVQQAQNPTFTKSNYLGACDPSTTLESLVTLSADTDGTFDFTGGQYHYNWSTKGITQAGEYRIYANLADGTKRWVDICLTK